MRITLTNVIAIVTLSAISFSVHSQNTFPAAGSVGIGTNAPNPSSALDITSTTQGILVPRMSKLQKDAIPAPATGLLVYQTSGAAGFYYFDGAAWKPVSAAAGANKALSNLNATSINQSLVPAADISYDLGNSGLRWRNAYFGGTANFLNGNFTGEVAVGNVIAASKAGAMRFNGLDFEGWDGIKWKSFTSNPNETDPQVGNNSIDFVPRWDGTKLVTGTIYDNGSKVSVGILNLTLSSTFEINAPVNTNPFTARAFGAPALKVYSNLGTSIGADILPPANGLYVDGRLGLGTAAPAVKVEIVSNGESMRLSGNDPLIQFNDAGTNGTVLSGYLRSEDANIKLGTNITNESGDIYFNTAANTRMFIRDNGNVGISTVNPAVRLHVRSDNEAVRIEGTDPFIQFYEGGLASGYVRAEDSVLKVGTNITNPNGKVQLYTWGFPRLTIDKAGNVGIGTTYLPQDYRLSVGGKVICEEVKVQLSNGWPDYVFQSNYDLRSLSELEEFISQNKHLPGIPPAAHVESEGLALGEIQTKLVEKIEELTLYMIELNKKVVALEQENSSLRTNH